MRFSSVLLSSQCTAWTPSSTPNGGLAEDDYVLRSATDPSLGMVRFKEVMYDSGSGVLAQGHFSDNAVYLQDSWKPVPRLTISAGVRIDHIGRFRRSPLGCRWRMPPTWGRVSE